MTPIETLIELGSSNTGISKARVEAEGRQLEFPHNGCANFLSALLEEAGLGVGTHMLAEELATTLKANGWNRVPVSEYQPGDIGVTFAIIDPPNADHIYLVLKRLSADLMTVVDNQAEAPHDRPVHGGRGKTATHYFLRFGDRKAPITVMVNGNPVADADGYVNFDDRAVGWVRPIANAIGANIVSFQEPMVTLSLQGRNATFRSTVKDGRAYIRLADLRQLPNVQVAYDAPTQTIQITV